MLRHINTAMKLNDIFGDDTHHRQISDLLDHHIGLIRDNCSQFLQSSNNLPVFKTLEHNTPFVKVKARMRKQTNQFSQVFNETFDEHTSQLRQRAIFAHGASQQNRDGFQYYIFAPDGFNFLYNPQVQDSSVYENVYHQTNDSQLITQLLVDNYKDTDLPIAIELYEPR